jgi:pimeloyl-ACP methyl ester carboxylesterase
MLILSAYAFGQADLTLSAGSISSTSIKRGDYLNLTLRVSNTGNVSAVKSHMKIYVAPALSFTNAVLLSEISCEAIAAGQQTQDINYTCPLPYNINAGTNYVLVTVDSRNEVAESNESNDFRFTPTINVSTIYRGQQNLPYPVILVHGLNDRDTTWYSFLRDVQQGGYSYGGNMDFCLNQDGNIHTSYLLTDFKDWTDSAQISKGDFYTVNFDVNNNGVKYENSSLIQSNQSAIVKQGLAIQEAVKRVLRITGRDKVILLGHSMGGLASREYLQNRTQIDGKHHIAKLITIGTPHGGSNSSSFGLLGLKNGLDEKSEAVRDLRISYSSAYNPLFSSNGVYLFGGIENYTNINYYSLINVYNNVDVNCNGIDADGTNIIGLNQKSLPKDLPYTCIIGENKLSMLNPFSQGDDGVVSTTSANLNNYINGAYADTLVTQEIIPIAGGVYHSVLPSLTNTLFKGLDESNEYNTAYGIDTGKTYFANFTVQSKSPTSYNYDYDDYKISIPQNSSLNTKLYNIPTGKCYFNLLDTLQNIVYKDSTDGQGYYEFNKNISKGQYFVEFYTKAEDDTWRYPYAFKVSATIILPLEMLEFSTTKKENLGLLNWLTANEINIDKFLIEKSYNSFDWITIGSLNSNNVSGTNNYNYTDSTPRNGVNYYRLKIMDKDGSFTYSQIKSIDFYNINAPFVIAPNPASSQATIFFKTQVVKAEISVYDVQGKLVLTQNAANTKQAILKTDKLNSGTYMVNINADGQVSNQQLLIAK